jgi:uncharacterized protein (DUF302 family)
MDRLVSEIGAMRLTVFARIDHAAGAAQAGLSLRATELLIFGNAKGGTPLMECEQTAGIDLPLKVLVWEDSGGKAWIAYNDPGWIVQRHAISGVAGQVVAAMTAMLSTIAQSASGEGGHASLKSAAPDD